MSEKFTSGPWFADDGDSFEPGPVVVAGKTFVCTALLRKRGEKSVNPTDDFTAVEAWANARLIAAAPDLYAALELARGYVHKTHGTLVPAVGENTVVKPDLDKINAALAKARGEA